ncbi:DUF5333 domain-containing protein [Marinovum sp. 2_MG-2023]|uniref:DUF5333 domain-containing protein n=1 Tax=Roseobacteraceae TaxID=2854170 RepID=UPI001FD10B53|nr:MULTISPECIES: DUF5333 domain-containing protein [Roseobacteraceae]MCJ7872440.1 DUF5333 domain-containing protein [Phaeobacter sp. J2-8]MDO6732517.1 DUF5333 domain-containing protein [Marinovum sp. 2_MG-2023]MDO6780501.1 DUF5333 domain-containing protein [Marinovum sp. 1_MG-2023]
MMRLALISLFAMSTSVAALPPLSSVAFINDGLRSLMIADQIRIACPSISARMVAGWSFARSLQSRASEMGYSKDEISDFVESKAQRKRLEGEAAAYMRANGVKSGEPETYCALGRQEVAKDSQIGAFLRVK